MNSSLLDALEEAENRPSEGYQTSITARSPPTRGRGRTRRNLSESETVEILDESSNSSCSPRPSPVKRKSPRGRGKNRNVTQMNYPVVICESGGTSSASTANGLRVSSPRGRSSRGRGRGSRGRGRGTRGRAVLNEALIPKKLKGAAGGVNLVGIQRGRGSDNAHEDLAQTPGVFKGRRWLYTTPNRIVINSTPLESPDVIPPTPSEINTPYPGVNGMSDSSRPLSSDWDRLSTGLGSQTDSNVSTSEKDDSDTSVKFDGPGTSRRTIAIKQNCAATPSSPGSSPSSHASTISPMRKLSECESSEAHGRRSNKKMKSSHQLSSSLEASRSTQSQNRPRLGATSESPARTEAQQLATGTTRGKLPGLSTSVMQSLTALEHNLKGLTRTYTAPLTSKQPVSVVNCRESQKRVEVAKADSTIEVASDDDESKRSVRRPSPNSGLSEASSEGINFIPPVVSGEAQTGRSATIRYALCPNCGTWSFSLTHCSRCKKDFTKVKPVKYRCQALSDGERLCTKCGGIIKVATPPPKPSTDYICWTCRQNCLKATTLAPESSTGPGAAFGTKNFYAQKLQVFSSATTTNSRTARNQAVPGGPSKVSNRRKKARKKTEPVCISLLDSDEEDLATSVTTTTAGTTTATNNRRGDSPDMAHCVKRKAKMKNEAGEPVVNGSTVPPINAPAPMVTHNMNNSHPRPPPPDEGPATVIQQTEYPETTWDKDTLTLNIHLVLLAFGSKRFLNQSVKVTISPGGFKFHFSQQEHGCVSVTLTLSEIDELFYCLTPKLPTFFIKSNPGFATRVRSWMKMKRPDTHFDPCSKESYERLLFFRPKDGSFTKDTASHMADILTYMKIGSPASRVFELITTSKVNELITGCTPPKTFQAAYGSSMKAKPVRITPPSQPSPKTRTRNQSMPSVVSSPSPSKPASIVMAPSPSASPGPQVTPSAGSQTASRIVVESSKIVSLPTSSGGSTYLLLTPQLSTPTDTVMTLQRTVVQAAATSLDPCTFDPSSPHGIQATIQSVPSSMVHSVLSAVNSDPSTVQGILSSVIQGVTSTSQCSQSTETPYRDSLRKVLTYPPPPTMGGVVVTVGDLECLQEGEFLNDVIIEFYLRYLLEEMLSREDRQRTHIFSSFFYKRLTQRSGDQDKELTAQEKRHLRVHKWTRRVDLFEKDFIIIPINESSHWYVAIICFPSRVASAPSADQSDEANQSEGSQSDDELINLKVDKCVEENGPEDRANTEQDGALSNGSELEESLRPEESKSSEVKAEDGETGPGQQESAEEEESKCAINQERTESSRTEVENDDEDNREYNAYHSIEHEVPCILIMDSLKSSSKRHVIQKLREYLEIEWRTRKNATCRFTTHNMKGSEPNVPQQSNYSDCGVYVLQYVEQFFKKPIRNYHTPIKGLTSWFPESEVKAKRAAITQLILDLKEKQETKTNNT